MVALNSDITVGTFRFDGTCRARTKRSIHSFVDTATISLPATSLISKESAPSDIRTEETARLFKVGDAVTIKLGYDDDLQEEFTGFVRRLNLKVPFELECEGYSWKLAQTQKFFKSWKTVTLKEVLELITAGTGVTIHPDTPATTLGAYIVNGRSAFEVLEDLVKTKAFTVYFIGGTQLYCGPQDLALQDKTVKHWLGWNTVKDDQLRYRRAEDVKIFLTVKYKDASGKTKQFTDGEKGGIELSFNYGQVSEELARSMARRKASLYVYEGYEGRIVTPLQPYCQPGWKTTMEDEEFGERNGDYIIETVESDFGPRGGWRNLEIGKRISKQR